MPFKSTKQRRWMWANKPALAKRWTEKYGSKPKPSKKKATKSKSKKRGK